MYQIYKVEQSDTLENIARKFGTTIEKLREINGLGEIYTGGYILVPSQTSSQMSNQMGQITTSNSDLYTIYIVKQGDNVYAIAREYGVPYETLLRINGLNEDDYIYPNQQLLIPKSNSGVYVTKETDTLASLYNTYKNNWDSFLEQNKTIYVMPDQMITYR